MFESITLQYKIMTIPTVIITEHGQTKEYITNPTEEIFNKITNNYISNNSVLLQKE